jgi:hypothetical protein
MVRGCLRSSRRKSMTETTDVSRTSGIALVLAAVLVLAWSVECRRVRRTFGEGGSLSTALGIHDVTSSDMPGFRMMIGESVIDVNFAPGTLETPLAAVHHWISASACAVTTYYGRFPVKHLHLLIVPVQGRRAVLSGGTQGYGGASTKVFVGQLATEENLKRDWVMTHEMVHLAFPSVAEEHHWIEERLATYVEPIARVEAGNLEPRVGHRLLQCGMQSLLYLPERHRAIRRLTTPSAGPTLNHPRRIAHCSLRCCTALSEHLYGVFWCRAVCATVRIGLLEWRSTFDLCSGSPSARGNTNLCGDGEHWNFHALSATARAAGRGQSTIAGARLRLEELRSHMPRFILPPRP